MISRRRAILVLALTSVMLITLDMQGSGFASGLRSVFGGFFRPVEGVVRVVTNPISSVWHAMADYDDVLDENKRLRDLVARQEGAAVANIATLREAQELLALNGLPTLAGIDSCTAQVVGESPTNFSQSIEINQGTDCGIRVGMPVLNAAGLIGKVTRVYRSSAVVMLITDPAYSLSVKVINQPPTASTTPGNTNIVIQTTTTVGVTTTTRPVEIPGFTPGTTIPPTTAIPGDTTPGQGNKPQITVPAGADLPLRETGALEGRGISKAPIVRFIEEKTRFGEIYVGSPVISAGGQTSLAPPDIVVGTVSKVIKRGGTLGPLLEVKLTATIENLNFVRVLLYQPATERPGS